ncbi:MAG: glycosyl transferase [Bacillales bacterium]|nr:glycosyl transferase [Bacillales bacterium]
MQNSFPTILIPALNPDIRLLTLVDELNTKLKPNIIVVNDGSDAKSNEIFNKLREMPNCSVITHSSNLGKGMALKSGLKYFQENVQNSVGIVTADCDGQHTAKDIELVGKTLQSHPDKLILGVRTFEQKDIPFRSWFGNTITRKTFTFLTGMKISDTQTGLRGIPTVHMSFFSNLSGKKFEYELNMLLGCKQQGIAIHEEKISTIYLDNNSSSHFNPLVDSIKVYFVLLKFISASVASFAVDYGMFLFLLFVFGKHMETNMSVLCSGIISRVVSSIVNYVLNCKAVFKSSSKHTVLRYYILASFLMVTSSVSVTLLQSIFDGGATFFKIIIDSLLFISSFTIQREWVFAKKSERKVNDYNNQALSNETNHKMKPKKWIMYTFVVFVILSTLSTALLITFHYVLNDKKVPVVKSLFPSNAPKRMMVIYPHPDDEINVAGTVLRAKNEEKAEITMVVLTKGEAGKTGGLVSKEALGDARKKEGEQSSKILGAKHVQGDYLDGKLNQVDQQELKKYLYDQIQKYQPTIIVTYDDRIGLYGHTDHTTASKLIREIVQEHQQEQSFSVDRLYMSTLPKPIIKTLLKASKDFRDTYPKDPKKGLPEPNQAVIISKYGNQKDQVADAHRTQWQVMRYLLPLENCMPPTIYFEVFDREYFFLAEKRK